AIRLAPNTSLAEAERVLILAALAHHRGDKASAAETLGISLKTLYTRLQIYGLGRGAQKGAATPAGSAANSSTNIRVPARNGGADDSTIVHDLEHPL
ncbi:MAG: helix-turn-helix domain-containing protein, partial [Candidatus Eiseniibacteriota bacterium]